MFTKLVLPQFGGAPAVWNAAVVFFQGSLLAGYVYAHVISKFMTIRAQLILHACLLISVFVVLPITLPATQFAASTTNPILALYSLLLIGLGLPFFAVSSTAPLMQAWFSRTKHKLAGDPYFLYAASNAGSLIALVSYPVLIEPNLGLDAQNIAWAGGYLIVTALILLVASRHWLMVKEDAQASPEVVIISSTTTTSWTRRIQWVVLAFAPSSLLLAVTHHVSTDVASVPFLWVIPLATFLATFVLVFAKRQLIRDSWMLDVQPLIVIPVVLPFFDFGRLWLVFTVHLLSLFVASMVCHARLAKLRPDPKHLTEFYLWMSLGGVLGGLFAALLAPALFDLILEYPLSLGLACLLRPGKWFDSIRAGSLDLFVPVGLLLLYATGLHFWSKSLGTIAEPAVIATFGALGMFLYFCHNRPMRFGLGVLAIMLYSQFTGEQGHIVERERTFFGVNRIERVETELGIFHVLMNGTTIHGAENLDRKLSSEPLTYYTKSGPLGQLFEALNSDNRLDTIGVIGLGAGTIACYRQPGQAITFFEIDAAVVSMATNPEYFRYISECAPEAAIVVGDGRLGVAEAAPGEFDLLVVDAFSSDAIPVHLLTSEAVTLYFDKISGSGLLALHISNRFVDLEPVVAAIAADHDLAAITQSHEPEVDDAPNGNNAYHVGSAWIVVGRRRADLEPMISDQRWLPLEEKPGVIMWTDDYSNVFRVLSW